MLTTKDENFLKDLLYQSFVKSGEFICPGKVNAVINYILLDASDIYQRCGDAPYSDTLVYSAIELCLYRAGYLSTPECFLKLTIEEDPRMFEEESMAANGI